MTPVQKAEEKTAETLTPMMQQTQDMIRQNLISQGFKPATADTILRLASDASKGKEITFPRPKTPEGRSMLRKARDAVEQTRDQLTFMPKLMKKGYTADEAYEIVDRARQGLEMPGFNRIEKFDVSAVKDALDYARAHPKENYKAAAAGAMFKGPARVPGAREKPADTAVASADLEKLEMNPYLYKEGTKKPAGPTVAVKGAELEFNPYRGKDFLEKMPKNPYLAAVPKKSELKPPVQLDTVYIEAGSYGKPKLSPGKAESVTKEYAYNIDIYGQKYSVTLNKELKGKDLKTEISNILQNEPAAVLSVTTPRGDVLGPESGDLLKRYTSYLASQCRAFMKELKVDKV
ncbi:hypothetical protein H0O00_00150 [Candidatus Micrarchaeota archaeon]|nr:hypothetical protein [Candidatus Micrarchaeota archaeon]